MCTTVLIPSMFEKKHRTQIGMDTEKYNTVWDSGDNKLYRFDKYTYSRVIKLIINRNTLTGTLYTVEQKKKKKKKNASLKSIHH